MAHRPGVGGDMTNIKPDAVQLDRVSAGNYETPDHRSAVWPRCLLAA